MNYISIHIGCWMSTECTSYIAFLTRSHRLAVYNRAFGTDEQGDACEVEQIATPSSILVHCQEKSPGAVEASNRMLGH